MKARKKKAAQRAAKRTTEMKEKIAANAENKKAEIVDSTEKTEAAKDTTKKEVKMPEVKVEPVKEEKMSERKEEPTEEKKAEVKTEPVKEEEKPEVKAEPKKTETEKRVAELLEQCGLDREYAKRYPHEVSGGQCQRAAISRALAVNPKILICDEATSELDVKIQKQIMELLQELKEKQGLSFIFICHNLALVQMFCDRVLVLYEGKVVEGGTPDEIINYPKMEYTQNLIDSVL